MGGGSATPSAEEFRWLKDEEYGLTVEEIVETHAVVQGLRWTAVTADAGKWRWAAEEFHDGAPTYLRLLRRFADGFGNSVAFALLPRLCVLALQDGDPRSALARLLKRVAGSEDPEAVSRLPPLQFCRWAGADPQLLARSLRERDPGFFQDNPWTPTVSGYFDQYEQVGGAEARLNVLLGSADSSAAQIFQPWFALFGDGQMLALHRTDANVADYATWTTVTLTLLEALELLR
jgi:hypothetical protein